MPRLLFQFFFTLCMLSFSSIECFDESGIDSDGKCDGQIPPAVIPVSRRLSSPICCVIPLAPAFFAFFIRMFNPMWFQLCVWTFHFVPLKSVALQPTHVLKLLSQF